MTQPFISRADTNAANRAAYEARLATEQAEKAARKASLALARQARATAGPDASCGHVEATGNPRSGCDCATCTRRRTAKSTRQRRRRAGIDHDDSLELGAFQPDLRAERFAKYNITPEQYYQLLASQGYACAICGTKKPGGKNSRDSWHIDHDHNCCPGNNSCGKCIRGLLCRACNWGLGQFGDSVPRLEAAIEYLEKTEDR